MYISGKQPSSQSYQPVGDAAQGRDRARNNNKQVEAYQRAENAGTDQRNLALRDQSGGHEPVIRAGYPVTGTTRQTPAQIAAAYRSIVGEVLPAGPQANGQVVREEASLRARQAVATYQTHQQLDERYQLTDMLGIDEYA